MLVRMLEDITTDETCRKDDIVVAKYLYDGKYQLLYKYNDKDKKTIDYQCYQNQIKEITPDEVLKIIFVERLRTLRKHNLNIKQDK